MVREIYKLLWYCQKEKWQHYLLKGFPDSCDRLSLKAKLTTNALLSPFLSLQCKISQFASFGKCSQLNRLNAFFYIYQFLLFYCRALANCPPPFPHLSSIQYHVLHLIRNRDIRDILLLLNISLLANNALLSFICPHKIMKKE